MKHLFLTALFIASLIGSSSAWALFETNKELANSATVPMDKAVQTALTAIPGKAIDAELGKEEGRTVYKVEIIDTADKSRKVYVDAQTMAVTIEKYTIGQ